MSTLVVRWLRPVAFVVGLAFCAPAEAAPTFPDLTGRVVDQADVLPTEIEASLAAKLEALEASTSRQLVVVTVPSLQGYAIEEYGYQLGRAWGIGEARKDTGVLFLVAPNERQVRVEVGYGLEPFLTDAFSNAILQNSAIPLFRDGKIPDGVVAGTDALIEQLSLPPDQARARVVQVASSGEAVADPISLFLIGFVVFWFIIGLIGTISGRRTEIWFWPLLFMTGARGRGTRDVFRGRGGSFGGGGASGRW